METTNIYILIDPITNKVRYVGKANNVTQRYKAHLNRARRHQIHKKNWIENLKRKGLKPIMVVIDEVSINDWVFWESYWISQFKSWGYNLINYTKGGDGTTFGNDTSFKKGQVAWNDTNTFISCKICNKEFKISPNQLEKKQYCSNKCYADSKKGISISEETQFKKGHVPWNKGKNIKIKGDKNVYQYSGLTGEFIKKWNTAKEAAIALNINAEGIGQNCRGKAKTAGGYSWSYDELINNPVKFANKANKCSFNNLK